MRIAIVGPGAIGCLWGIRLHQSGQEVLLVHHRKKVVVALRTKGVRLRETTGRIVKARIDARQIVSRDDPVDLVLLTVKAYDTESAARALKRSLRPGTPVLSLQNGLGNIEVLSRQMGRKSILGGATSEGAMSMEPGKVVHTGKGRTWIGEIGGSVSNRVVAINEAFQGAGFVSEISKGIEGVLWAKAIVNSAINPISALTQLPNGGLGKVPGLVKLVSTVVLEGMTVSRSLGIVPRPDPKKLISQVLRTTARNKSSMLLDVQNGEKTEIRQMNGMISELGKKNGVLTPLNNFLTALVVGLETSSTSSIAAV